MKNIIARLVTVEEELRREQSEMAETLADKVKIIQTQEKQITSLDGANQRLLNVLGQLRDDDDEEEKEDEKSSKKVTKSGVTTAKKMTSVVEVMSGVEEGDDDDEGDSPMTPTSPPPPSASLLDARRNAGSIKESGC